MSRRLSFYIHIPYCVKRCGYCDFNTYTPAELKGPNLESVSSNYIAAALKEIEIAQKQLEMASAPIDVPSIFFGGGTPSLMPAAELIRVVDEIRNRFNLLSDAEITVEVNPDSVTQQFLSELRNAGVNRVSMGMQSAVPHVLNVLDRTHNPENVSHAVETATAVGFDQISVDLIYGSPSETIDDWRNSIQAALSLPISHISAYALIVEKGTKLAAQISRGDIQMPPDDETAEKYRMADEAFSRAGFNWYELSNWSTPGSECRHNISYWDGSMWWGVGPGAHSYVDQRRWWNVKHPTTYQQRIMSGETPIQSEELLTAENLADEFLLLQIRRREGIPHEKLNAEQIAIGSDFVESGHLDAAAWQQGKLLLTLSGRLIADRIVRSLVV